MADLVRWLMQVEEHRFVPLSDVGDDLVVNTKVSESRSRTRRVLRRNGEMEDSIISIVEKGIEKDDWQGLFYVMGRGRFPDFTPMYIGITRKGGGKRKISSNIKDIRNNRSKFARWGDGGAYHIGDLSKVVFGDKKIVKYESWALSLFASYDPPQLKEPIYFYAAPWYNHSQTPSQTICSIVEAEKELIRLGCEQFGDQLLNRVHRVKTT